MVSFFPFTHITEAQRRILGRFFKEVRVLDLGYDGVPSEGDGYPRLIPCRISKERAAHLESKLAEYLSWAQLHRGNERNLKQLLKASPYFKTDTDLTSIKSQISRGAAGCREAGEEMGDPGLFLKLAQTLDRENDAIASRLQALDLGKEALLAELKGEPGDASGRETASVAAEDQGQILPDRRLAAWAELACEAGMFAQGTPVLVTTSPGFFSWLTEGAEEVINGLDIDPIKVHEKGCGNRDEWFRDFDNLIDQISAGSPPNLVKSETLEGDSECCHLSGQIKIRLFPDGTLNKTTKIPGSQLTVCLVGLNS